MTQSEAHERVSELIPFYVNRSLLDEMRALIEEHLDRCDACRSNVEQWQQIAHAVVSQAEVESVVREGAPKRTGHQARSRMRSAGLGLEPIPEITTNRLSTTLAHSWSLLRMEARLMRKSIWVASISVIAMGVIVQAVSLHPGSGSLFIQMLAPLFTAGAVAFAQAPEVSGSDEVLITVPTSSRTTLIARLSLVFCFNTLAFGAAAWILGGNTGGATLEFVLNWFAPMALLASFALLAATLAGPRAATAASIAVWCIRILSSNDHVITGTDAPSRVLGVTRYLWESPWVWLLVLCQLALAWWLTGRDVWALRSNRSGRP